MAIVNIGKNEYSQYLVGLSTDTKPTKSYVGDIFYELDTGKKFRFNGTNWVERYSDEISIGTPSDSSVTDPTVSASLISILKGISEKTEQTIINADEINLNTDGLETLLGDISGKVEQLQTDFNLTYIAGTATEDSDTGSLIDNTKSIDATTLDGKSIRFTIDNVEYIRIITSAVGNEFSFAPTDLGSPSSVTVTGATGGSMTINCIASDPNTYSVILVAGYGNGVETTVTLEDKLLTITSPTDSNGDPTDIMPGNVEGIIQNTPALAELFLVENDYVAGFPLDIIDEPVTFSGGRNAVNVVAGTRYIIF